MSHTYWYCDMCGSETYSSSHVTGLLSDFLKNALKQKGLLIGTAGSTSELILCLPCSNNVSLSVALDTQIAQRTTAAPKQEADQ